MAPFAKKTYPPVIFSINLIPPIFPGGAPYQVPLSTGGARRVVGEDYVSSGVIHHTYHIIPSIFVDWQAAYLSNTSNDDIKDSYGIQIYNDEKRGMGTLTKQKLFSKIVKVTELPNPMDGFVYDQPAPISYHAEDAINNYFALEPFSWTMYWRDLYGGYAYVVGTAMAFVDKNTVNVGLALLYFYPEPLFWQVPTHRDFGPLHLIEYEPYF